MKFNLEQYRLNSYRKVFAKLFSSSSVMVASIATSGISFLVNILYARGLGVNEFGTLRAVLSLFSLISVPLGSLGSVTTKFVADYTGRGKPQIAAKLINTLTQFCLIIGILTTSIFLFFPPIQQFLEVQDLILLGLVGFNIALVTMNEVFRGAIRGWQFFKFLSFIIVFEVLLKFAGAVILHLTYWTLRNTVLTITLASFVSLIASTIFLFPKVKSQNSEAPEYPRIFRYFIPTLILAIHSTLTANIDILIVNSRFSATEVGIYSTSTNLANLLLVPISAVGIVIFPKVASLYAQKQNTHKTLLLYSSFAGLLGILGIIIYALFPDQIILITYGVDFLQASSLLVYLSISKLFDGISGILLTHEMAVEKFSFFYVLILANILRILILLLLPTQLTDLCIAMILASTVTFALLITGFLIPTPKKV